MKEFVRKAPLSDVETAVAPVKHCFSSMQGCVYVCVPACVSPEHVHSTDGHSGIGNSFHL